MTIATYEQLSGETVSDADIAKTEAQIRKTRLKLESMLGYSLEKTKAGLNQYDELGKTNADCVFYGTIGDINYDELDAADSVQGSYRLFPYNRKDQYFAVDPFTTLYAVKLVFLKAGDEPNGVTHRTFDTDRLRIHKQGGFSKYIERCKECFCSCFCEECVQLAVDALWLNEDCLPEALQYVWADMVAYYANPNYGVIEETLGTHRYKLRDELAPEMLDENLAIIKKYAGPNGSLYKTVVI